MKSGMMMLFDSSPEMMSQFEKYLTYELFRPAQLKLVDDLQKELDQVLINSEGGYDLSAKPFSLLDFASWHPSMGFREPKPKNHYERMMSRRKKK